MMLAEFSGESTNCQEVARFHRFLWPVCRCCELNLHLGASANLAFVQPC